MNYLRFPHKAIRAEVIKKYMKKWNYDKAVCFSCGNASARLKEAGVNTLAIATNGELTPNKWFEQAEIAKTFPGYFDATSGNLPIELMNALAKTYKDYLGELASPVYVPTGSGETLVCLKMAYPEIDFIAVYNLDSATEYSESAPLNSLVKALAKDVIM